MSASPSLVIEAELDKLEKVRQFVAASAEALGADRTATMDLRLAVDEVVTNIVIHGYKKRPGTIHISIDDGGDALIIRVRDQAPEFNPCVYEAPDMTVLNERDEGGGFGIPLIRQSVDDLRHRVPETGGNELILVKQRGQQENQAGTQA